MPLALRWQAAAEEEAALGQPSGSIAEGSTSFASPHLVIHIMKLNVNLSGQKVRGRKCKLSNLKE